MKRILALDQGTTSCRAMVFDDRGAVCGYAQQEFEQHFPRSGWVEHDAQQIWRTQLAVARQAMERAGLSAPELAGIGIANQRETTVVWNRHTGEPIHRAIVWQDRRTAGICDAAMRAGHGPEVQERTGLVIDAYFSGSKIGWILDHVPGARRQAERGELAFGTIDSWLVWKLTGGRVHVTDASNASRTMLMNLKTGAWDDRMLKVWAVPAAGLAEIRSSSEVYGHTQAELLGAPVPIAGMAGDQQAALFGQACFKRGDCKNTYGTGCFALIHVGDEPVRSAHRLLSTVAWQLGGQMEYALEGSVFVGGAVVQWLRDGLGIISSAAEVETLARRVQDNGGVYLVPAFAGLGAPYWDQYARGTITGLTRGTTAAHVARAALEGIAHQVADVLEVMRAEAGLGSGELRVDGGAATNDLLMQIQADVLESPVIRPVVTETTALGAAYLAGLAVGVWSDRDEIARHWRVERRFEPSLERERVAKHRSRWHEALSRARQWEDVEREDADP